MSKILVVDDQVTVRGYRRMGRSPRKVLAALRAQNTQPLIEQLGAHRNERRQQRADRRAS